MAQHRRRIGAGDPVPLEEFARQVEAAALRILIEIAQDIGELQSPA